MNAILTLGALVVAGGISVAVMYPDVATVQLIVVLGITAVVLPIVLYPFTNTLWFAVEILMEPPSASELAAARDRVDKISPTGA